VGFFINLARLKIVKMNKIEVCLTPELFNKYSTNNKIVVIVDILRATSIITTMFHNGLEKLIPANSLEEAKQYKKEGYLVAAERNGKKVDFADFGNSPFEFTHEKINNETLVYSTTNGTNTINLASKSGIVIIASFLNLTSVSNYLINQQKDVLILCSGWEGNYCIEDSLFAGALVEKLLNSKEYIINCDSGISSLDLWLIAKIDIHKYIKRIFQYDRLVKLGLKNIIKYCFSIDITKELPIVENYYLVNSKDR
jgi:2-phosphosulfolactate phosphatase